MPSSLLFGLNNDGRVFGLSTNGTKWREFVYLGLEFKQLSAVPHSLWAVGGDRQIYVHVHGLDVPIRVKEESYENERWTPVHGFSCRLLPTDRHNFSTADGTREKPLKRIRLPSMAWQWEGEWHLECQLDGQPLDDDGWSYAVDFPATYYPKKQWTSCVRRRKWIRYRRYSALNSWCAIAPLHKDATQEPFIGVGVGGHEAGFNGGRISVWAVTAHGRVMFRTEVSTTSPEGQRWNAVPLPPGCDVQQLTVGATGLVWTCLQNGKALVRVGVTRDCILGTNWVEIPPPGDNLFLNQVSLGSSGLWAVTRNHKVWFRRGIRADLAGASEEMSKGTAWVEMVGDMSFVSVAPNDQVFAIGALDKMLYFRTGVSQEDLTGKMWRQVGAPTQLSRTGSVASLFSGGISTPRDKRHRSWTSLNRRSGSHETARLEFDLDGNCHSAPALTRPIPFSQNSVIGSRASLPGPIATGHGSIGSSSSTSGIPSSLPEEPEFRLPEIHESRPPISEPNDVYEDTSHPVVGFQLTKEQWIKKRSRAWSPQRSGGSIIGVEAHSEVDSSVFDSETMVGVYGEVGEREDEDDYLYWADSEALWSSVEAGACLVHNSHLPGWFAEPQNVGKAELERPWRVKILEELRRRIPEDLMQSHDYEKAVDTSSWVKTANVRCLDSESWQEASLSLEWVEGENAPECGTVTVCFPNAAATYAQCSIAELSGIFRSSEPGAPRLTLHRGVELSPIELQFSGEDDLEDWMQELHELSRYIRKLSDSPCASSLWMVTVLGDVHAFDSEDHCSDQTPHNSKKYVCEIPLAGKYTPIHIPLCSGFNIGCSVAIHGVVPDGSQRFSVNLICGDPSGDIAFHFNPRFTEDCVIRNARRGGAWGPEDRRGAMPFVIGQPFCLEIFSEVDVFRVHVNGLQFTDFGIRSSMEGDSLSATAITYLTLRGDLAASKVTYSSTTPILYPPSMFFRHIGGHLRKVESAGGVTWGIGYDGTPWVYTGGTGGPFIKGSETSKNYHMVDGHVYYVYENQRWNPLTGYTGHGLPTDRHMWSDVTGRHKRTMDKTKLLSKRWQWEGEWAVDFSTPGGVDKEGWQYAVDFPASYSGTKHLTDYVRRRRWKRKARCVSSGPWRELGHTPLLDCSLHLDGEDIVAWGAALNGDVLYRTGITPSCPAGLAWEHVPCEQPIMAISSAPDQLWGVGRSGSAFWRFNISPLNPMGSSWETVDGPKGATLKTVSVGAAGVWALDSNGRISVRKEVSRVFPSGSSWHTLPLQTIPHDSVDGEAPLPVTPLSVPAGGFRHVSAKSRVWAVTGAGKMVFRLGVQPDNAAGTAWIPCLNANLSYCSTF